MKTKEVIRQLMLADPSGELEVCVGNVDIHFIDSLPAYYDGSLQVLERDESNNVIGAKYKRSGSKINIYTLSITDAISNDFKNEFVIDYSELSKERIESTKKAHADLRVWHHKLENQLEWENFLSWVNSKVQVEDVEDLESIAKYFFDKNISPDDPIYCYNKSYVNSRKEQWDSKFEVGVFEGFLGIRNKQGQ